MRRQTLLVSIACLLFLVALPGTAYADLAVIPSKVEIFIAPGESYETSVTVLNNGDTPMQIDVASWDFARDSSGKAYAVDARDAEAFHACGAWLEISFGENPIVQPGENRRVSIMINAPETTDYGTYCTYVQVLGTPTEVAPGSTPTVLQMNALLLAIVYPPGAEGQTLDQVDELVREAILRELQVPPTNFGEAVPVRASIANNGNIHLNMEGYVDILKGATVIARLPIGECTLLPEDSLDVERIWTDTPAFGRFTARFWADAGLEKPFVAEREFWIISPWLIAAASGVLVIGMVGIAHSLLRIHRSPADPRDEMIQ